VALPRSNLLRLRKPSLVRGMLLSLGAFAASLRLAGFPDINALHGSPWQILGAWLKPFAACIENGASIMPASSSCFTRTS